MRSLRCFRPYVFPLLSLVVASCQPPPETPSSIPSDDGLPIAFTVQGSGSPALVFVHGWMCDGTYWREQVPHFSEQYQVVTIDLAGHGDSGLGRQVWSMQAFGRDVAAVVTALGLEEVVLIGHSMGGPVVVEAARRLGDRVKGIVGVDTFNDLSLRYSDEQIEEFVRPFHDDFEAAAREVVSTMFVTSSDSALADWIVHDMSSAEPTVGIGALEGMVAWFNQEAERAFGELNVTLRLINSDYNPTNLEAGRSYAPDLEVNLMTGVGHFVMMEDPDTFNRLLEEVLEDLPGGAISGR